MAEHMPSVEESIIDPARPEVGRTAKLKKLHLWIGGVVSALAMLGVLMSSSDREAADGKKKAEREKTERMQASQVEVAVNADEIERLLRKQKSAEGGTGTVDLSAPGASIPSSLAGTTKPAPVAPLPPAAELPKAGLPPVPTGPSATGKTPPLPNVEEAQKRELDRAKRDEQVRASNIMAIEGSARAVGGGQRTMPDAQSIIDSNPVLANAQARLQQLKTAEKEMAQAASELGMGGLPNALGGGQRASQPGQADANARWLDGQQGKMAAAHNTVLTAEMPRAAYSVHQGTVIPAVLVTEINSDMPGQLIAVVSMDVYDSGRGDALMIPKGSRLIGIYNNDIRPGQERVLAAFQRLILPNGASVNLQGMVSADAQGRSGLSDETNNHFFKMFQASFITAGLSWLFDRGNKTQTVLYGGGSTNASLSSSAGQILTDISKTINERNSNIPPTITIRQGHKFNVVVNKDMALSPFVAR